MVLLSLFAFSPFSLFPFLPNLAGLGADHRVAGLTAECAGELRQVRERPVDAEARERVRVGLGHQAH